MSLTNWENNYAWVECPSAVNNQCKNVLWSCMNEELFIGTNICPDKEAGQKVCAKHPELCTQEYITSGTVIGNKPPLAVTIMPEIVGLFLTLGAIGWFVIGRKEKQNAK